MTASGRPHAGGEIVHVVGARPNFVKMAPVIEAMARRDAEQFVVHTGQHYDQRMSDEMLSDLQFPEPDLFLGIGSGTHGAQTARALAEFEQVLIDRRPELVVVAGDVNSTLACALAAVKLGIRVAHVESGLRSGDWTMPEEVNRVLTDRLSDLLFTHSPEAEGHLLAEGLAADRIHSVGNTMIDSLRKFEGPARERAKWRELDLDETDYVLITLHRPSNVDDPAHLNRLVDELAVLARRAASIFPIHPRTRAQLESTGRLQELEAAGLRCVEPLGYLDFLSLEMGAGAVLTDSGGVQEETSALGVRCYTLRPNTERPVTITQGTNVLLGDDPARIAEVEPSRHPATPCLIPLWDGHAGDRIADLLVAGSSALTVARSGA
ncbi:MAG: UDP-N-acetylglucosamine 2-epimerase (non-hydrolyzing) [Actinomycetota bacterium]|nr:UDP-N-acetylglucosamine 2-epimerase (non-hydrolyzing) [Actinomycetota bacterium]